MSDPAQTPLKVLVAGGGVAGLETLLALRDLAGDRVAATLLTPDSDFVVRPWTVQEPFARPSAQRYPLERIAQDVDAELHAGTLASVDPAAQIVQTGAGDEIAYEALVVALGSHPEPAYAHATTFRGGPDAEAVHGLLQDLEGGYLRRIAFVVPPGAAWPLPLYELALMTAERARSLSLPDIEVSIVTPEDRPLAMFGLAASDAVAQLLTDAGVTLHLGRYADVPDSRTVAFTPADGSYEVDRVVALPRLVGRPVPGLPAAEHGFLPVDDTCAVVGVRNVWAAGDGTTFPIKQGGIAAQQADAAAQAVAAHAGVTGLAAAPFKPMLRGMLLTGSGTKWLRAAVAGGAGEAASIVSEHALWWPPSKIAGRYLAPYLATLDSSLASHAPAAGGGDVPVDVDLGHAAPTLHAEGDPAGGIELLGG
ncbi:MAG: NAD(P)/FAD-dependent oxidoreductase [Solirubrobacteraceae bacterium]